MAGLSLITDKKNQNMSAEMIPVVSVLSVFGSISFIAYLFLSTRNKERMALIERGSDASIFASRNGEGISLTLRLGLLAMGIGAGILLAEALYTAGMREDIAFPAMIFLTGGMGLLLAYMLDERNRKKQDQKPG